MTKQEFQNTLLLRLKWYQKAINIKTQKIPWENSFDCPDGDIETWTGAVRELKNTLDMLEKMQ